MTTTDAAVIDAPNTPPPLEINIIELVLLNDSKITNVSVYSARRAEVTRAFKLNVKTGRNQVIITGLPNALLKESFRVEGRGFATIHDVTISTTPKPPTLTSSEALKTLLLKKARCKNALERARKAIALLEAYLGTLNAQHVDVNQMRAIAENYDAAGGQLDDKVLELQNELEELELAITAETLNLAGPVGNDRLKLKAAIELFADMEREVEMTIIYAVTSASWNAGYDIRVDMNIKESPVTLVYKAAITQNTGEDWSNAALTLETASPTFGLDVPTLNRWPLSIYHPPSGNYEAQVSASHADMPVFYTRARMASSTASASRPGSSTFASINADMPHARHRTLRVTSHGTVSATFGVPGLMSIPSDGVPHNVTIVELKLDAKMNWLAVPKVDAKMHLSAKIKNASAYTLLPGQSSVYVDGSFISRSDVPSVSPDESFDCLLGLDPAIGLTYHPLMRNVSQSGFYTKSTTHRFTQRITVHNTKSIPVEGVKIIDQVPVSEDEQITVKVLSPALVVPDGVLKTLLPVQVAQGVVAQWDGAEEPGFNMESLGKDGRVQWTCAIPPQEKINLELQWEVVLPAMTEVVGLTRT